MSLSMFIGSVFNRKNNTRSLLIFILISSTLLLSLSCFDQLENQGNYQQAWLLRSSSDLNANGNANARLRQQIARLSDGVGKITNGKSVILRSPKMLLLQQQQQSPEKMKQSSEVSQTYIDTSDNHDRNSPSEQQQFEKRSRQLAYLVSPFSEQVLEIGQQLGSSGTLDSNSILEDRYKLLTEDFLKPILVKPIGSSQLDDECRTIRANIKLEKDDFDKVTGRIVRTCRGLVQVNKCEGSCTSTVRPSIKSPSGFIKVS